MGIPYCGSCGKLISGQTFVRNQFGNEFVLCTECTIEHDKRREKPADNVNHPAHYKQGGIECIDAIEAAVTGLSGFEGMCTGNAIKYLFRWKHKAGIEDLKKAVWYVNRLIQKAEGVDA